MRRLCNEPCEAGLRGGILGLLFDWLKTEEKAYFKIHFYFVNVIGRMKTSLGVRFVDLLILSI